jgi:hypothetical protein
LIGKPTLPGGLPTSCQTSNLESEWRKFSSEALKLAFDRVDAVLSHQQFK